MSPWQMTGPDSFIKDNLKCVTGDSEPSHRSNLVCLSAFEIIWWRNLQVMSNGYTQCGYHCCISLLALDLFIKKQNIKIIHLGPMETAEVTFEMCQPGWHWLVKDFFQEENHCVHMRSPCCALQLRLQKARWCHTLQPQGLIALFLQKPESWQLL